MCWSRIENPRSPERGQYGFVQALIREVAYGMLARRDRRSRHLAAARYFESLGDDELAGVLATHYVDAYRASDEGPEAEAVAAQARIALRAAAERAAALHSPEQALAFLETALEVTRDPAERAALLELGGNAARAAGDYEAAERHLRDAADAYESAGERLPAGRATAALGLMHTFNGRPLDAIALLERALERVSDLGDAPEVLAMVGVLARSYLFADDYDRALKLCDRVLASAERVDDVALVTDGVLTKGTTLLYLARYREGLVLLTGGLHLAETHGLVNSELRARLNISFNQQPDDPRLAYATARTGLERARRLGFRDWTRLLAGNAMGLGFMLGDWDACLALNTELLGDVRTLSSDMSDLVGVSASIRALRGELAAVEPQLEGMTAVLAHATASQERSILWQIMMWLDLAAGRYGDITRRDLTGAEPLNGLICHALVSHAALWELDAATARKAREGIIGTEVHGRWVSAIRSGLEAGIAALDGHAEQADAGYREALDALRQLDCVRDEALMLMDQAAVTDDPTVAHAAAHDARVILERLAARALLDRLDDILARRGQIGSGSTMGASRVVPPAAERV